MSLLHLLLACSGNPTAEPVSVDAPAAAASDPSPPPSVPEPVALDFAFVPPPGAQANFEAHDEVSVKTWTLASGGLPASAALFTIPEDRVGDRTVDVVITDMFEGGIAQGAASEGVETPEFTVELNDCGSARYAVVDTMLGAKHATIGVYAVSTNLDGVSGVRAFMLSVQSPDGARHPAFDSVSYAGIRCAP